METKKMYSKKCRYFILLIFCITGMVIYDRSLVFAISGFTKYKLIVIALNVIMIGVFPFVFAWLSVPARATDRFLSWLENLMKSAFANRKKLLRYIGLIVVAGCLSWVFEYGILHALFGWTVNEHRCILIYAVLLLVIATYGFHRQAGTKPELYFMVTALILGGMLVLVSPAIPGNMVDDGEHYVRALAEANFIGGSRLDVEDKVLTEAHTLRLFDKETQDAYYAELNAMYEEKTIVAMSPRLHGMWSLAYIPSALGIIVGTGLSMSYVHVFMMGKFFNLLFYILIFYFAIRKIPTGKVLLAVFGLLPTNIFMASNYSYDPWVIAFTVLSYSYFLYEIQNPEKPLEVKNIVLMVAFLLIGCSPKAVYCVLGLPFLFMPKKKFRSVKQRMWYYLPVVAAGICLAATFVIPAIKDGVGAGDLRGGDGINATVQLANILADPAGYLKILVPFLKNYLSIYSAAGYIQMYFWWSGSVAFVGVTAITLVVVAFLDKQDKKGMTIPVRLSGIVASLCAVAICATVMYIVFTPVGADTINGCQGRYILPAVIPFLIGISPDRIKNHMNPSAFVMIPSMIFAATFLYNVYNLCIQYY